MREGYAGCDHDVFGSDSVAPTHGDPAGRAVVDGLDRARLVYGTTGRDDLACEPVEMDHRVELGLVVHADR